MTENHEIHLASPEDAATIGSMLRAFNDEFHTPGPTAEQLSERLHRQLGRDDLLVLLSGPRHAPTGFLLMTLRPTVYADGPLTQVEELYVVPEHRGRQHGTRLLQAAIRYAVSQGYGEIHIPVDEVDVDARRFYERHGFVNVERQEDGRQLLYTRAPPDQA